MEADLYSRYQPGLSELIEGSLGELSPFHQAFGYRADGVSPSTAILPPGWEQRLIRLSNEKTGGAIGWCLEPHDLAVIKLSARREKDLAFVAALPRFKMVRHGRLQQLIQTIEQRELRERLAEALALCKRRE